MRFEKWQALGNDYVIVEERELIGEPSAARAVAGAAGHPVDRARPAAAPDALAAAAPDALAAAAPIADLVRAVCDRHRGVGADGVLVLAPADAPGFVARLRVFNPDGSEAEISGNGARQAILYLRRAGWSKALRFSIQTAAGEIRATILTETSARMDMGRARLGPTGEAGGFTFQHLTIGNPQATIAMASPQEVDALDLALVGPPIEADPRFPERTNVSWYAEAEPGVIRARIFERGVGETESSGTGACGAAIGYVLGGGDSPVIVRLDGGELEVEVGEDLHVDLTGWAVPVFAGEIEL